MAKGIIATVSQLYSDVMMNVYEIKRSVINSNIMLILTILITMHKLLQHGNCLQQYWIYDYKKATVYGAL